MWAGGVGVALSLVCGLSFVLESLRIAFWQKCEER